MDGFAIGERSFRPAAPLHVRIIGAGTCRPENFLPLQLTSVDGSHAFELWQPTVTVGRHSEADVQLSQPDVSRFHCRLVFERGRWCVEDLTSLNGTLVNGKPVEVAQLSENDLLRVGPYLFHLNVGSGSTTAPPSRSGGKQGPRQVLRSIAEQLPEA